MKAAADSASAAATAASAFERRAARAAALGAEGGPARGLLAFAAGLLAAQGRLCRELEGAHAELPFTGSLSKDAPRVLALRRGFFRALASGSPEELAREAEHRAAEDDETAFARLTLLWEGEPESHGDLLSRALLRPYVETLLAFGVPPDRLHREGHCPACGGRAQVAIRRSPPETHGAQRLLGCGLCGGEWPVNRIRCAACGEENPEKLPIFHDARHPLARIEACESCRRYVKSIDLTLDARAIPEVDELVSVALDLWAAEQGYERIEPGLAGI